MESLIGHCWNCNEKEARLKCSRCVAIYCNKECRKQDIFRHQVECKFMESFGRCSLCKKTTKLKWCENCIKERYCSRKCQTDHWPVHQPICKDIRQNFEAALEKWNLYPKIIDGPFYWGNTLAVDYLKLFQNEGIDSKITLKLLFAACGDIRHMVKTMADLPPSFKGKVEFFLNDHSALVMARNVLFLYLAFTSQNSVLCSQFIVQLWYSLLLTESHYRQLKKTLIELCLISSSELERITHGLLHVKEEYLNKLKDVWRLWLQEKKIDGKEIKEQWLIRWASSFEEFSIYLSSVPPNYCENLLEWFRSGLLLKSEDPTRIEAIKPNVTLLSINPKNPLSSLYPELHPAMLDDVLWQDDIDWRDVLILFWDGKIMPFQGWDYLDVKKYQNDIVGSDIVGMYQNYLEKIIEKFLHRLGNKSTDFHILIEDITQVVQNLPLGVKFDRIATSNIADSIPEIFILKTLAPVLNSRENPYSVLVTEYLNWVSRLPNLGRIQSIKQFHEHYLLYIGDLASRLSLVENPEAQHLNSTMMLVEYKDTFFGFLLYMKVRRYISEVCKKYATWPPPNDLLTMIAMDNCIDATTTKGIIKRGKIMDCCGLKMREFWKELNRIIPFSYKVNGRRVNYICTERSIEWVSAEL